MGASGRVPSFGCSTNDTADMNSVYACRRPSLRPWRWTRRRRRRMTSECHLGWISRSSHKTRHISFFKNSCNVPREVRSASDVNVFRPLQAAVGLLPVNQSRFIPFIRNCYQQRETKFFVPTCMATHTERYCTDTFATGSRWQLKGTVFRKFVMQ